jgi:hypothetical protein
MTEARSRAASFLGGFEAFVARMNARSQEQSQVWLYASCTGSF